MEKVPIPGSVMSLGDLVELDLPVAHYRRSASNLFVGRLRGILQVVPLGNPLYRQGYGRIGSISAPYKLEPLSIRRQSLLVMG